MKIVIDKVNKLEEEEKRLFELRYSGGLSWREVGKEMGMSGQAALNFHNRLIKKIRKDIPELVD
jgi:DNA-directed RNA polymerase specialized sigma subunit